MIETIVLKCRTIYRGIPPWLRIVFVPLKLVYWLVSVLRHDLWIMTGEEASTNRELTITYAGNDENRHFLRDLAFRQCSREEHVGTVWLWGLSRISKSSHHEDSLLIAEVPRSLRALFKRPMAWYVPCWVHGQLNISDDRSPIVNSRSLRSDINKIKKSNLEFEVSNDASDCYDFYHNMHLPFVRVVHGSSAVVIDYEVVKQEFRRCDLVFVKKGEERLAGALIRYSKSRADLWFLGVKNGDLQYVKDGVLAALYYFPLLYLQSKGVLSVDLGPSRAFLKHGVLQYKKKWDQTLNKTSTVGFLIRPLSTTAAVQGFLHNNPFIFADKGRLNGAVFTREDEELSADFFAASRKAYLLKGMSKVVVYGFGAVKPTSAVPPDLSDTVVVRSLADHSR